ncbi:MAG: twin-arginine translocation signal domain-containing protein [Gammaproteobacteria bacterium]|jgi:Arc/MetJ family transcription regulator
MKKQKEKVSHSRREFLRGTAVTGGAAAVVMAVPAAVRAQVETPEEEQKAEGYRLSRHVLDYYKSAAC